MFSRKDHVKVSYNYSCDILFLFSCLFFTHVCLPLSLSFVCYHFSLDTKYQLAESILFHSHISCALKFNLNSKRIYICFLHSIYFFKDNFSLSLAISLYFLSLSQCIEFSLFFFVFLSLSQQMRSCKETEKEKKNSRLWKKQNESESYNLQR